MFYLAVILCSLSALGQSVHDSARTLPGIEIRAKRDTEVITGMKSLTIDSLSLRNCATGSLNELLDKSTSLYTKTYGQGGMSSLSFRGTTASQSGVFWNGFNINGRSTAMADLSLIPVFFFRKIDLMYGGSSSHYGSGNIGGSIHLNEVADFKTGVSAEASMTFASFGALEPGLKVRLAGSRWSSSTAFLYRHADNDYPYSFAGTELTQENAAVQTRAFYQQFDYKLKENNQLNLGLWIQDDDRELPPPATGSSSVEHRRDKSLKVSSRWKSDQAAGTGYSAGIAYLHDNMHYTNVSKSGQQMLVDSRILNDVFMADASAYKKLGKSWEINLRLNYENARVDVNSFGGNKLQASGGLSGGLKKQWYDSQWITVIDFRQEWAAGYEVPFCPYFGVEGRIRKDLKLYANASKNYRIPSLNDRYWVPGGNEDLLPETSLNMEAGLQYHISTTSSFHFDPRFSVFISDIEDQIVWIPQGSLWSAENLQHVTNKGIELGFDLEYSPRKSRIALKFDYTYVSSENNNKSMQNDASAGKQQIYTPQNRAVAKFSYGWGKLYSYLNTSYTGIIYCTRDNSEQLPPNTLLDLGLRYRFTPWHKAGLELAATINNLLDQSYQFIQYYPAPGRNFSIELICKIN